MLDLPKLAREVYGTEFNTENEIKFKKMILDLILEDKKLRSKCDKLQHEYNNLYLLTTDSLMDTYNQEFELH